MGGLVKAAVVAAGAGLQGHVLCRVPLLLGVTSAVCQVVIEQHKCVMEIWMESLFWGFFGMHN